MTTKKHYKLYKAGKQWCTAAIMTLAVTGGVLAWQGVASADTTTTGTTQPTTTVDQNIQPQTATATTTTTVADTKTDTTNNDAVTQPQLNTATKNAATVTNVAADQQTNTTKEVLPTGQPGWSQKSGNWYYFNNNGTAATGWKKINQWYYFDETNGQMQSGLKQVGAHYYYLNPNHDGTFGAMQTGWQKIDGHWYGFGGANDGAAYTGWRRINGSWYYFQQTGQAQTGWYQSQANNWFYFDPTNAWALTGWQRINNSWYYFDAQNAWALKGWQHINNSWYYFDPTNAWALTGWQKLNNNWYYFDQNNAWALTGWQRINNRWYNFDRQNAWALKGWQHINNSWYYFDPTNAWADTNWQRINNNWYYFDPTNAWALTGWQKLNNRWYYFDKQNAWALTGWQHINNSWYYFDENNAWALTGFQQINNHWYYFDPTNAWALTGWQKLDGDWYYFDPTNAWALTGHQMINGKSYYFNARGQMKDTYAKIENGKLVVYNAANNQVVKTLDSGTWENIAYSLDGNSINNIDGYLSYTGWYRPYGTSQDGKTWYKTSASDWRPMLMYVWPSKDVQAQFIKYFVNHGYVNEKYGLTTTSVAQLSKDTDTKTLNDAAQNLRYVIEQHIAANKSTSQLANDVNGFMATVPELSAASELSVVYSKGYKPTVDGTVDDDQLLFVNNNSRNQQSGNTSTADSNYRLVNRTINNQTGSDHTNDSPELLVGNDIDNSNPVVQAENLNWEYFLLNYGNLMGYNADGNFDGFRIDAADNTDADVLDQVAQLMNDLYHIKGNPQNANEHLLYNEGYHSDAAEMLNKKGNQELFMDAAYFYTLENVLGKTTRDNIGNLMTNSVVNRTNDTTENQATPNWSFVTNHDQRKNTINTIIVDDHPNTPDVLANGYKAEYAQQAWKEFYADQAQTVKRYAQYNVPAQYALLLTNKDTVPQVYYGDLYDETDQYMQTKSMYYDAITALMKARKTYVSGGQTMTKFNDHLIASVRYGKGVTDANSRGTDPLSRTTGIAVVVGNDATMGQQTIAINMGKAHANQLYRNLLDSTANGLTENSVGSLNSAMVMTDANGILHINVQGYANPYVSGYLSVWAPVISVPQDASTAASAVKADSSKFFESNAALDSHMIYEDFSLFQPEPTSQAGHAYNVIAQNANLFSDLGITDFWMAPAYMPFGMSRYNEGYSTTERYNLGTNAKPTKYGSGQELANAIAALHAAGLKVQEDLVMNQMIGFGSQEAVTVTRTDANANQLTVDGKTFANQIYFAYTRGGGDGQKEYGGKYLAELKAKYPDLFTTKAASTGVAPDPNTRITEWSAKYENGTSLQNLGIGLAVKLANGNYAYLNDKSNNAFSTLLPDVISSPDYYADQSN
ncbi:glycoside hydrolase family 70 protein [Limosilactobacillus kribbianus]|uniref:glycoside hydrolase family 70 protein n=1 Tax=Limosilactobacillus kribbianus TaxID=2982695 RepID=UPI0022644A24|nr:glycoside hydrolase family 70 protein [Limosilactobacillus kribbianus]